MSKMDSYVMDNFFSVSTSFSFFEHKPYTQNTHTQTNRHRDTEREFVCMNSYRATHRLFDVIKFHEYVYFASYFFYCGINFHVLYSEIPIWWFEMANIAHRFRLGSSKIWTHFFHFFFFFGIGQCCECVNIISSIFVTI